MNQNSLDTVYSILEKEVTQWDVPVIDLVDIQTQDPFKTLVATILTARTKDSLTITILPRLWKKVNSFADLEKISQKELEQLIYPVGFYRTKAANLKKLPAVMKEEFDNVIPQTVDELVKLPGVGRKTANLVVAVAFKKPAICVDVHVHRIMNRFGYLKTKTPYDTEMELRSKLPKKHWRATNLLLVAFGQNLCKPVSPFCSRCPVRKHCARVGVTTSR